MALHLLSGIHTAFNDPNQLNLYSENNCSTSQASSSLYRRADGRIGKSLMVQISGCASDSIPRQRGLGSDPDALSLVHATNSHAYASLQGILNVDTVDAPVGPLCPLPDESFYT